MRQKKLSDYLLRFAVLLAVILLVLRLTCPSQTRIACVGDSITYVPAELLIYPDENHWVLKPQNGVLWQRTFFEWLDKWVKKAPSKYEPFA